MLYGVFMRYVMLPITDWLDVDPVNFFWVEEVGETTLCWLTLIGAAVGVAERSHFTLTLLVAPLLAARAARDPCRQQPADRGVRRPGRLARRQAGDPERDADLAGAGVQPGLAVRRRRRSAAS